MFSESDLKQIKNLVLSFRQNKKYFPFVEDLEKEYSMFFPQDLDDKTKEQINDFINDIIKEEIEKKWTKWWLILSRILKNNQDLWTNFRKLNSERNYNEEDFQTLWKKVEQLIEQWESQLVEKLVWNRSMWITKASDAWYDMVYAIFPEWNKIR